MIIYDLITFSLAALYAASGWSYMYTEETLPWLGA
jgi:hypothetical protein